MSYLDTEYHRLLLYWYEAPELGD